MERNQSKPQGFLQRDAGLITKHERIAEELERFLEEAQPEVRNLPQEVVRILEYVHHHLFDPDLTVGHVRAQCGIRNHNVSSRFRRSLGVGIRDYIEMLRLRAADRLLQLRNLEVYLIALAVGYEHQETFSRAFRRYFGHTPSEHRQMAWQMA